MKTDPEHRKPGTYGGTLKKVSISVVILGRPTIPRNVIAVGHYLLVLTQLRGFLLKEVLSPGM